MKKLRGSTEILFATSTQFSVGLGPTPSQPPRSRGRDWRARTRPPPREGVRNHCDYVRAPCRRSEYVAEEQSDGAESNESEQDLGRRAKQQQENNRGQHDEAPLGDAGIETQEDKMDEGRHQKRQNQGRMTRQLTDLIGRKPKQVTAD